MNKKGFTLIELLAVIVILIIIFMITVPAVTNIISTSENTVYQKQVNTILNAAYDWSLKNVNQLPEEGSKKYITLSELMILGLIDKDMINPNTGEIFPYNVVVSIENVGSNRVEHDYTAKLEGNYLYSLILPDGVNEPIITLKEKDTDNILTGNYVTKIESGKTLSEIIYFAKTHDNIDISKENFSIFITLDDKIVSELDTNKVGIYKVYYTVVDDEGNASTVIRPIIIEADVTSPTLEFPIDTILTEDDDDYDFLSDVICTDKSGTCIVSSDADEVVDFDTPGEYIITYTAKDINGNTTTKERLIEIE